MTPKAGAAYQRNIAISHFLPLKSTKARAGLSPGVCARAPEPWVGEPCFPTHTCTDYPRSVEEPPGSAGLFVSTEAYVFPGETLLVLWNLT